MPAETKAKQLPDNPLYNAVMGLAVGDALGVPYEFRDRGSFNCTGMTGYGSHQQPAGTWSDDTSLTLATLKSLKDRGGKIDLADIRNNFLKWYHDKEFTADGTLFDIGVTTSRALTSGQPCTEAHQNGNGSLMRILPLAFVDCTDAEIRAVSGITHANWIAQDACVIYIRVAKRLLAGEKIRDVIPTLEYGEPFQRLRRVHELDRSQIRSSGYVVNTLEAALWAAGRAKDYRSAVLEAVNLGDDTDTVAAVAGGLAGILFGLDSAGDWIGMIRNRDLILSCLWDPET